MKYIKMFEDHNSFSVEEYFKDKINWEMMEYIKYISTNYTDSGYNLQISIYYANDDTAPMSHIYNFYDHADSNISSGYDTSEQDECKEYMSENDSEYGIIIYKCMISKEVSQYEKSIPLLPKDIEALANKISTKFDIEILPDFDNNQHEFSLGDWFKL